MLGWPIIFLILWHYNTNSKHLRSAYCKIFVSLINSFSSIFLKFDENYGDWQAQEQAHKALIALIIRILNSLCYIPGSNICLL